MGTNIIFNPGINQYGEIISEKELSDTLLELTHQRLSKPLPKDYVIVKYERPIETNRLPGVASRKDWHIDIIPKAIAKDWALSEDKLKEDYENEKNRYDLLKKAYERLEGKDKEDVKRGYTENNKISVLEDKLKRTGSMAK